MSQNPQWREEFDEIQKSTNYSEYTHERFCCGGDYCQGDHNGFIKSFIANVEADTEARIRQEAQVICLKTHEETKLLERIRIIGLLEEIPDRYSAIDGHKVIRLDEAITKIKES